MFSTAPSGGMQGGPQGFGTNLGGISTVGFSPQEQEYYTQLFRQADQSGTGLLEGVAAANFLMRSGVPRQVLHQIWSIADVGSQGVLTIDRFFVACRLVAHCQNGQEPNPNLAQVAPSVLPYFEGPTQAQRPRSDTSSVPGSPAPSAHSELQPVIGGGEDEVRQAAQAMRSARSPSPKVFTGTWVPSQREKRKYACLFNRLDWDQDGYILGGEAKELLDRSQLDDSTLSMAWEHADQDRDGKLDFREFVILVHMVTCLLRGARMPSTQQGPPPDLMQALGSLEPMHLLIAEREASRSRSASPAPSGLVTPTGGLTPRGRGRSGGMGLGSTWDMGADNDPSATRPDSPTWGAGGSSDVAGAGGWGPTDSMGQAAGSRSGSPLDAAGPVGFGSSEFGGASAATSAPGFGGDGGWGSANGSPTGFGGSAAGLTGSFTGQPESSPFDTGPMSSKKDKKGKKSKRGDMDGFSDNFGLPPSETIPVGDGQWGQPDEDAFGTRQSEHERRQMEEERRRAEEEQRQRVQMQLQTLASQFDSIMAADREVSRQLRREVDELGQELEHLHTAKSQLMQQHEQERAETANAEQNLGQLQARLAAVRRRLAEVREERRAVNVDSLSLRRDREHCAEEFEFMQVVREDELHGLNAGRKANSQLEQTYLDLEGHTEVLERQRRGLREQVLRETELVRQEERQNAELRNRLEQVRRQHAHHLHISREAQMRIQQTQEMREVSHGTRHYPAAHSAGHLWAHTMATGTVANVGSSNVGATHRLAPPSLYAAT